MKLPTEAKWEYAALSGTNHTYSWGNQPPSSSRCVASSKNRPAACGSYPPNRRGIHDMTGNVWEWTRDRYEKDYYSGGFDTDPQGPVSGTDKIYRGGSFDNPVEDIYISKRFSALPTAKAYNVGIRCVIDK